MKATNGKLIAGGTVRGSPRSPLLLGKRKRSPPRFRMKAFGEAPKAIGIGNY